MLQKRTTEGLQQAKVLLSVPTLASHSEANRSYIDLWSIENFISGRIQWNIEIWLHYVRFYYAIEWFAHLRIPEILGPNLGPKAGYSDGNLSSFSPFTPGKMLDWRPHPSILCLTKYHATTLWRRMGLWRYNSTPSNLGIRRMWVVSFTTLSLYPPHPGGRSPWHPLDRRLDGPQIRSGRGDEEK